jgi:hypothetical protein
MVKAQFDSRIGQVEYNDVKNEIVIRFNGKADTVHHAWIYRENEGEIISQLFQFNPFRQQVEEMIRIDF